MPDITIEDLSNGRRMTLRINGTHPTFRLVAEAIEAAAVQDLDPTAQDFLEIAAAVFHADGEIGRGGDSRPEFGRSWHRRLRVSIPVRELALWQRADVTRALTDTVKFLTDDHIEFAFTRANDFQKSNGFFSLDPAGAAFEAEEVILFSGGLDSFAGALEALSTRSGKVLLVSHRSAPKVHARQDALSAWLNKRFFGRIRHVKVAATRIGSRSQETTQRSRSLLFAAIGHAVARSFGTQNLSFYENGIVSHNLPISPQVVGTMATRTTHPDSIAHLNRLLALIAPSGTKISNPYQWLTKTEVIERIERHRGVQMIGTAVSCTRVIHQTKLHTHCGRCSQCLDRRFAILAAGLEGHDPAESYAIDVLLGARTDGEARTIALEWTRHALTLSKIEDRDFGIRFGTEITRILNGFAFDQRADAFQRVVEMHRRHGAIVRKVLKQAIVDNVTSIADHQLRPTCLVKLWISSDGIDDLNAVSYFVPSQTTAEDLTEADYTPSPNGPWTATFSIEGEQHVVAVRGLANLFGRPALVSHRLKDIFLEDQRNGLAFSSYRHVLIYSLPGGDFDVETAKQNVRRCRKTLAEAYEELFGAKPAKHLLIESGGKRGHRLDPMTNVIDRS